MTTATVTKDSGERTVLGACAHDCPDTCSMIVSVKDGKVTGVRGNPDHPFTQGGLCVKVNHYEERVHHPDRILYPLRRKGAKGSGQFERITWDAAIDEIASRWKDIISRHGPTAILPYSYLGTEGILNGLNVGDPFFNKLGATVSERTFCDSGASTGYMMTVGPRRAPIRKALCIPSTSFFGPATPSAPICIIGPLSPRRKSAAPKSWWSIRCAAAPPKRPTGTFPSNPAPTARSPWG